MKQSEPSRDVLATADASPSKINPSGPRTEKRQWHRGQSWWSFQTLFFLYFLLPRCCPFSWQKGHWATLTSTWRNAKPAHKEQEQGMLAAKQAPAVQVLLLITSYTNTTNTTTSGQEISFSLVSLVVIPFSFLTAFPQHWGFLACVLHWVQSRPTVQLTRQHLPLRLSLVCLLLSKHNYPWISTRGTFPCLPRPHGPTASMLEGTSSYAVPSAFVLILVHHCAWWPKNGKRQHCEFTSPFMCLPVILA